VLERAALRVLGGAAAAVDRAATLAAYAQTVRARRKSRAESLGHSERMQALSELASEYDSSATDFFPSPRAIDPAQRVVRTGPGAARVVDLSWVSEYQPFTKNPELIQRFARYRENGVAAARLFSLGASRPVAVLVHGYMAGQFTIEQHVWPIEWLQRIGLDVALFVLPFHGVRANPERRGAPPFPGADPRMSNEGFRQAIGDFHSFVGWLRQRGHRAVGVMGMSLGGYTTALAATVVPDLAFAVPIIPLASLADFARDQGRLGRRPEQRAAQHAALDRVYRVVSPLDRKPLIAPERVLVIGARADRITPMSHAKRLARHFGARLEAWPGGHLLQLGRAESFRRIGRMLGELGLASR
jgi:pimeloyl-ACP methyl ester carboxylesterase